MNWFELLKEGLDTEEAVQQAFDEFAEMVMPKVVADLTKEGKSITNDSVFNAIIELIRNEVFQGKIYPGDFR
jgi:hypothetical protein